MPMNRCLALCLSLFCLPLLLWGQDVDYDAMMCKQGLVDLASLGQGITVELKYSTTDNFTGKNMYGNFRRAYLVKPAAQALQAALRELQAIDPDYGFVVYDAARPMSVQRKMWKAVQGTVGVNYVAPPRHGGPHNYGVALDISLTYKGRPVDMGTPFDTFTADAHITGEKQLVKRGRITLQAMNNRQLLRKVLTDNGFLTYSREWWHFEYCRASKARQRFSLLNF